MVIDKTPNFAQPTWCSRHRSRVYPHTYIPSFFQRLPSCPGSTWSLLPLGHRPHTPGSIRRQCFRGPLSTVLVLLCSVSCAPLGTRPVRKGHHPRYRAAVPLLAHLNDSWDTAYQHWPFESSEPPPPELTKGELGVGPMYCHVFGSTF